MRDWELIYQTIMNYEYLTIKQIQLIANVGQPSAIKIRDDIRESVYKKGKKMPNEQTPTRLLLEYLGKSEDYYWKKLKRHLEIEQMKAEINV